MQIDLAGKTAVVTGGSRGIGRSTCRLLAGGGANVVIGYRSAREEAESLRSELVQLGVGAIAVGGDVSRSENVRQLYDRAEEAFGDVAIAIGNAGIWKRAPIDEMTEAQWQEMIDVNLKSVFLLCHHAVRRMKPNQRGAIVLVGSTAGQRGEAFHSHYAATKGAIQAFVKSLAAEVGPWGIRVNCVAPGWVDTDMTSEVFAAPGFRAKVEGIIPLGSVASPDEVASAAVFLASDLASHIQGEILNVNGGSVLCG